MCYACSMQHAPAVEYVIALALWSNRKKSLLMHKHNQAGPDTEQQYSDRPFLLRCAAPLLPRRIFLLVSIDCFHNALGVNFLKENKEKRISPANA